MTKHDITLCRFITMFCGTNNIMWTIPHIQSYIWGIFRMILSVPQNIVMNMNNVMDDI